MPESFDFLITFLLYDSSFLIPLLLLVTGPSSSELLIIIEILNLQSHLTDTTISSYHVKSLGYWDRVEVINNVKTITKDSSQIRHHLILFTADKELVQDKFPFFGKQKFKGVVIAILMCGQVSFLQ